MAISKPEIIFGTGSLGSPNKMLANITTVKEAQAVFDLLKKYGVKTIDTSRHYPTGAPGRSEELIGQTDVASWANLSTKVLSNPGDHSPENIAKSISGSLEALKVPKVQTEYFHFPDRTSSLEGALKAMNDAHVQGQFERFGISNYTIEDVKSIMRICEANNYLKPTIYQGHYNVISRKFEKELIPILREYGMSFHAFSAGAGGSFNLAQSKRLNDKGPVGKSMRMHYGNENITKAVTDVVELAEKLGISGHEAAIRWVLHHSALDGSKGDAIVISARSVEQLEETLQICNRGPLPDELASEMDHLWTRVEPYS